MTIQDESSTAPSVTNIDFKNFNDDITTQIQVNNINSNGEGNFNLKVNSGTNLEEVLSVNSSEFDFKNKDLKNIVRLSYRGLVELFYE